MTKQTEFHVLMPKGYVAVKGREISVPMWPNERFFIHRSIGCDRSWDITHVRSGLKATLSSAFDTQADARLAVNDASHRHPDFDFDGAVARTQAKFGPMPELAVA